MNGVAKLDGVLRCCCCGLVCHIHGLLPPPLTLLPGVRRRAIVGLSDGDPVGILDDQVLASTDLASI